MVAHQKTEDHPLFALGVPILQKHYEAMQDAMDKPPHDISPTAVATHSLSGIELYAMAFAFKTILDINADLLKQLEEND